MEQKKKEIIEMRVINLGLFGLILILSIVAIVKIVSATDITACTSINSSGVYTLTQDILNSTTSYCMNISVSDVVLDCQGYLIDGNDIKKWAIWAKGENTLTNITIQNCAITDWNSSMFTGNIENLTILSMNFSSNLATGQLGPGSTSLLYIIDIKNGTLSNLSFVQNLDGAVTNYVITISNSTGISLSNTTIFQDGLGWYTDGIYIEGVNSSKFRNIYMNGTLFGMGGMELSWYTHHNTFSEILINIQPTFILGHIFTGVTTYSNTFINITTINPRNNPDSTGGSGVYTGLYLQGDNNTVINLTSKQHQVGLTIQGSGNLIMNSTIDTNNLSFNYLAKTPPTGILIFSTQANSTRNNISFNRIVNNPNGLVLSGRTNETLIYNNFFNNTLNFNLSPYVSYSTLSFGHNNWNVTKQNGTRIYTRYSEIGGNYYAQPNSKGYSQICKDGDFDGFCDIAYNITTDGNNTDYLPLTHYTGAPIVAISPCPIFSNCRTNRPMYLDANISKNATEGDSLSANFTLVHPNGSYYVDMFDRQFVSLNGTFISSSGSGDDVYEIWRSPNFTCSTDDCLPTWISNVTAFDGKQSNTSSANFNITDSSPPISTNNLPQYPAFNSTVNVSFTFIDNVNLSFCSVRVNISNTIIGETSSACFGKSFILTMDILFNHSVATLYILSYDMNDTANNRNNSFGSEYISLAGGGSLPGGGSFGVGKNQYFVISSGCGNNICEYALNETITCPQDCGGAKTALGLSFNLEKNWFLGAVLFGLLMLIIYEYGVRPRKVKVRDGSKARIIRG